VDLEIVEGEALPSAEFELVLDEDDGTVTTIPAEDATWTVDHEGFGEVSESGVFTASGVGGRTAVRAEWDDMQATAQVNIAARLVYAIPGAEGLPDQFAAGTEVEGASPEILYPATGTLLPRNVAPVLFQWSGAERTPYRITFSSPAIDLEVYTTNWSWRADEALWQTLANNGTGDDVVVQVSTLVGGTVEVGPAISISFSQAAVEGAIYYWAPSQGGIVRLPVGAVEPEPFLIGGMINCVGCHALSPDGSRLAYTQSTTGTPIGGLGVIGTDVGTPQLQTGLNGYYPSFAPDNVRLAAARGGEITIINTDTGLDEGNLLRPAGSSANYPAWSPRGDAIVYAAGQTPGFGAMASLGIGSAGLVKIPIEDGNFGNPLWLLPQGSVESSDENLFYPAISPDGLWVGFNRATADVAAGSSPGGSELWVVSIDGGEAVDLTTANGPTGTTNSWPKWAPTTEDGILWVAFTSTRSYGRLESATQQIWIAAVDPVAARAGDDPSWAAFWMPNQSTQAGNHIAYWAEFTKEDELEE